VLAAAGKYDHIHMLECLLTHLKTLDLPHDTSDAMYAAAKYGKMDVVEWLIERYSHDSDVDMFKGRPSASALLQRQWAPPLSWMLRLLMGIWRYSSFCMRSMQHNEKNANEKRETCIRTQNTVAAVPRRQWTLLLQTDISTCTSGCMQTEVKGAPSLR
jgi:hypothetical protein